MRPKRSVLSSLALRLKRRRSVLLAASSPMNFVCMAPVLEVLRADPDVSVRFTSNEPRPHDLPERAGLAPIPFVPADLAQRTRFDLYFCVDGTRFGKRCRRRAVTSTG